MGPGAIAQLTQDRRSRWRQYRGIPRIGAQIAMKSVERALDPDDPILELVLIGRA